MPNEGDFRNSLNFADQATLKLLNELESEEQFTQRRLASRIGVALGMTNSLLKRAVRKGLVKVKAVPAKRYTYYLTPKGFSEKSRLVADYLSDALDFFRKARAEYEELYTQLANHGHKRIALYGAGDLADIAMLAAREADIDLMGVIAIGRNQPHYAGLTTYVTIEDAIAEGVEAIVLATDSAPQAAFEQVVQYVEAERVFAVPLLHVSPGSTGGDDSNA